MKVEIDGVEYVKKDDEVTYSRGDRFKDPNGNKYLLCYHGQEGVKPCVSLTYLKDGTRNHKQVIVESTTNITEKEFANICDSGSFTRYWDIQKGE
ncbi:hypothetical protein LCGC14_1993870, partial [marine sediment metagenome]